MFDLSARTQGAGADSWRQRGRGGHGLAWQLLSNRGRLSGADREKGSLDFVFNCLGPVLRHSKLP